MKLKSIVAMAAVGTFACSAGAHAGWFGDKFGKFFHGDKYATSGGMWNGYEVRTPSSVNEAAPWLANEPHMPASMAYNTAGRYAAPSEESYATGTSSMASGAGSGSFDSTQTSYSGGGFFSKHHMSYGTDMSFGNPAGTPYWLLGE